MSDDKQTDTPAEDPQTTDLFADPVPAPDPAPEAPAAAPQPEPTPVPPPSGAVPPPSADGPPVPEGGPVTLPTEKPEVLIGGALAGGFLAALILKRLGRR